jgi:hypothetical protein
MNHGLDAGTWAGIDHKGMLVNLDKVTGPWQALEDEHHPGFLALHFTFVADLTKTVMIFRRVPKAFLVEFARRDWRGPDEFPGTFGRFLAPGVAGKELMWVAGPGGHR